MYYVSIVQHCMCQVYVCYIHFGQLPQPTYQLHLVCTKSWSQNASPFSPCIIISVRDEIMDPSINAGKENASLILKKI